MDIIQGNGKLASKIISAESFTKIHSTCHADLKFTVSESHQIEVVCDENLLDLFEFSYTKDVMTIGTTKDKSFNANHLVTINISAPKLSVCMLSGHGDADISGIHNQDFRATVNGSGDITLKGDANTLILEVNGTGDINAKKVNAANLIADLRGTGDIEGHATETLNVNISGTGDVTVSGSPKVGDATCTGKGSVKVT